LDLFVVAVSELAMAVDVLFSLNEMVDVNSGRLLRALFDFDFNVSEMSDFG